MKTLTAALLTLLLFTTNVHAEKTLAEKVKFCSFVSEAVSTLVEQMIVNEWSTDHTFKVVDQAVKSKPELKTVEKVIKYEVVRAVKRGLHYTKNKQLIDFQVKRTKESVENNCLNILVR